MNILFYIPELSQTWGGSRQYSKGVLEIMAKDANNQYFIYHNNDDSEIMKVLHSNPQLTLIKDSDVKYSEPSKIKRGVVKILNGLLQEFPVRKKIEITSIADILCELFTIDVIYSPHQFIPTAKKAKLIITMHDVQELHFPEFFTPQIRAYRATTYMDYLYRADKIIVSYNHVKEDLVKYFQIPENKIGVLLINMNDLWINHFSEGEIIDVKNITNSGDFLLYPANTWKHKNHLNLIRAVELLRNEFKINVKIVCTGNKNEYFEDIYNLIKKSELEEQIIFTGVVSEQTLYSLYKSCRAVIVPSLYEAGSFPLYESILLNVPVVCSNVTSLPETICNKDCLFNPSDINDIASIIKKVWTDENFRNKIQEKLKIAIDKINANNPLPVLQTIYSLLYL